MATGEILAWEELVGGTKAAPFSFLDGLGRLQHTDVFSGLSSLDEVGEKS